MMRLGPIDDGKPVTVCLDFDGVIHEYNGWNGPVPTGGLIPGVREALQELAIAGARIEVFSTRPKQNIQDFLGAHGIAKFVSEVRDGKPYYIAFFDDRAHNVPTNRKNGLLMAVRHWLGHYARARTVRAEKLEEKRCNN